MLSNQREGLESHKNMFTYHLNYFLIQLDYWIKYYLILFFEKKNLEEGIMIEDHFTYGFIFHNYFLKLKQELGYPLAHVGIHYTPTSLH